MTLAETERLARELLAAHGLSDWRFRFDRAVHRLGSCDFARRTISLSRHLPGRNPPERVRATLLHEIAHALVGPGHGHDAVWRACAQRLGVEPRAQSRDAVTPVPPWHLVCSGCGQTLARRHRRRLDPRHYACGACGPMRGRLLWLREPAGAKKPDR